MEIVVVVRAPILGQQRRKQVKARGRRCTQPDAANRSARDLLHAFVSAVDCAEDAPCFLEEDFTSDGQRDAARPIQELGGTSSSSSAIWRDTAGCERLHKLAALAKCPVPDSTGHPALSPFLP